MDSLKHNLHKVHKFFLTVAPFLFGLAQTQPWTLLLEQMKTNYMQGSTTKFCFKREVNIICLQVWGQKFIFKYEKLRIATFTLKSAFVYILHLPWHKLLYELYIYIFNQLEYALLFGIRICVRGYNITTAHFWEYRGIVSRVTMLWDGLSGVWIPKKQSFFFFFFPQHIQSGSGTHAASYSMGMVVPSRK